MKTYSVKTFMFVTESGITKRSYETIKTGLTWQEAKAARVEDRTLQIVPE